MRVARMSSSDAFSPLASTESTVLVADWRTSGAQLGPQPRPTGLPRAAAAKTGVDPFVEVPTKSGLSLDLTDDLRLQLSEPRFKYIYIYASATG